MGKTIQLTTNIQVNNSAHILYLYKELETYLNNLIAYIRTGIK